MDKIHVVRTLRSHHELSTSRDAHFVQMEGTQWMTDRLDEVQRLKLVEMRRGSNASGESH